MSDAPLLDIRALSAGYGRSRVLSNVDLQVPRAGAVAVLGRNGAGKTTLLKTVAGELPALGGSVEFDGQDATRLRSDQRARRGLGYVPQEHAVFSRLSVRENLAVGNLVRRDRAALDEVLTVFPKLGERLDQAAGTLSGGERKMLAIARALLLKPRLLLLDEPTEGVWVGVIEEIAERLRELVRSMAVLLVEQHLGLALGVAEYAYVLGRGGVALEAASATLSDDPRLLQYLAP